MMSGDEKEKTQQTGVEDYIFIPNLPYEDFKLLTAENKLRWLFDMANFNSRTVPFIEKG